MKCSRCSFEFFTELRKISNNVIYVCDNCGKEHILNIKKKGFNNMKKLNTICGVCGKNITKYIEEEYYTEEMDEKPFFNCDECKGE